MSEILPRPMVLEEFTPLVGRSFTAHCDPQPVNLMLIEASPLRPNGVSEQPPFILIFHTPPEAMLIEGNYTMKCGNWGPDVIYLFPTTASAKGTAGYYYQAIFN